MSPSAGRARDPQQRAERAERILDVTADLLQRHGYRRVTIDDVAAGAGIGKGTIYLHWKTRTDLFAAVFAREVARAIGELADALRQDPRVCLPHLFARTYFLAIMKRPLLRAILLADPDLLGRGSPEPETVEQHRVTSRGYFRLLSEQGLLRDDLDVDAVAYAFFATFEGFLRAEAEQQEPFRPPDERADLLAHTVQRAFESDRTLSQAELQSVADKVNDLLSTVTEPSAG